MSQPRKLHLFNCDRTYKLDAVEGLLNGMKVKLGFESVEKHYFSLSQMSEMSTKTIPELQMDMAFFVVHAHESRLSINEDNAGIGYAKIYNALLKATGGNVIIVIGGDDNYKNEDEEDRVVISRWARRKISSQFNEECLDGRKSFIFSWNKKHREIHEEALLHYFASGKKGQKFEYQPKIKPQQAEREPSGPRSPLQKAQSMSEQRTADKYPLQRAHSVTDQRTADSGLFSPVNSADQRTADSGLFSPSNILTSSGNKSPFDSEQGPKDLLPLSTGRTTTLKDWVVLGCSVSKESIHAVKKVMQDIAPKLNLSETPPVEDLQSPDEAKRYLTRNTLNYCVLVVDAGTVKDAYQNLSQQKVKYKELLETAVDKVDKKVIILICDTCSLPPKDEAIVNETIECIVNQRQKGFTAWLKRGKLAVEPDVLVEFLKTTSPVPQTNPQTSVSRDFQESPLVAPVSTAESQGVHTRNPAKSGTSHGCENAQAMQPPVLQWATPIRSPTGEIVKLKCMLRYGVISSQLMADLQIWDPQFRVPDDIIAKLYAIYQNTPVAGVRIVLGVNGQPECYVDSSLKELSWRKGLQIAANDFLMLKTRLNYGLVSFQENDVHYRCGNWVIPQYIVDNLKQEWLTTPCADLCVISDKIGNLRCRVKVMGKIDRVRRFAQEKKLL